jgi:hypothetical protein
VKKTLLFHRAGFETKSRFVVHEASKAWRSRLSLNDNPSFCATPYIAGGVGELYQRQYTFLLKR